MPNIMMTDACNLNCPYCFANEFVNQGANEISREAFLKAVDFLVGDGTNNVVGLIGGEPTLHSDFDGLLRLLLADKRVHEIAVYTNGILIDRYVDLLTHPKVRMLVNCNSPETMGQARFERMADNVDLLVRDRMVKEPITLGITLYGADFAYDYMLDLLTRNSFDRVRVSIAAPNTDEERNANALDYFRSMKPRVLEFLGALLANGIVPFFDDSKMPPCVLTEDDIRELTSGVGNLAMRLRIVGSKMGERVVRCEPVVDVLQDLTAVRCFGLSRTTRQHICDFAGLADLRNYYFRTVDHHSYNACSSCECADCYDRKVLRCNGGCLAFKEDKIQELEKMASEAARTEGM